MKKETFFSREMKRHPTTYSVIFHMEMAGASIKEVQAVDIQDAIKQVVDPIRQKYGDVEIFITTVAPKK